MIKSTVGSLVFFSSDIIDAPHAFSSRKGGVSAPPFDTLNLGKAGADSRENILENYARFCAAAGVTREAMVFTKQVHGVRVRVADAGHAGEGLYGKSPPCDALITDTPGLPITVFGADCAPILLYDPDRRVAGAVHAGWRGTALGIVARAVAAMENAFGTDPSQLRAAIGPSICADCFVTDRDVPEALARTQATLLPAFVLPDEQEEGRFHVDLKGLNRVQLLACGLDPARIDVSSCCTCCDKELFYSHRRDGVSRGLQASVIQVPQS